MQTMNNKFLMQDGASYISKCINKHIVQNLDHKKTNLLFNRFQGGLFAAYQTHKPQQVLWPISEYSQEVHDFINEYHNETNIWLLMDAILSSDQDINSFFNRNSNIKIICPASRSNEYKNILATFDKMYDDKVFYNMKLNRNNKILTILSADQSKNESIEKFVYPYSEEPIVAINNPSFQSPVNVGVALNNDLNNMLNEFSYVLDLDGNYILESSACDINYLDITNNDISKAISERLTIKNLDNLSDHSYNTFVVNNLISHIKGQS